MVTELMFELSAVMPPPLSEAWFVALAGALLSTCTGMVNVG